MITMLVWVLIIAIIGAVAFYFVDAAGTPYPINMLLKVVIAILVIYGILQKTGLLHGLG